LPARHAPSLKVHLFLALILDPFRLSSVYLDFFPNQWFTHNNTKHTGLCALHRTVVYHRGLCTVQLRKHLASRNNSIQTTTAFLRATCFSISSITSSNPTMASFGFGVNLRNSKLSSTLSRSTAPGVRSIAIR
jgi:hypothetical protein